MKDYRITLMFLFCLIWVSGFSQKGVQFLKAEWGEVLALAELEGKLIFVDAYTDWCAPCKLMDKEVFSTAKVGEYYNSHFVNVKINMEKGEGIGLAEKYKVRAYPSLLFVNSDGSVAHRFAGFKDVDGMLQLGDTALDEEENLEALEKKYTAGERSEDFLIKYLRASFEGADGNHSQILTEYLATQKDWNTPENKELIFQLLDTPNSPLFDYLAKNRQYFYDTYGEPSVEEKIQLLVYDGLQTGKVPMSKVDALFETAYPDRAKELSAKYKLSHYRFKNDGDNFGKEAVSYLKKFPKMTSEELNDISWTFYDLVDNKKYLKKAAKLIKRAVRKDNSYLNNDSLAALYAKLGKQKQAIESAKQAIEIAIKTGENFDATNELIEELMEAEKG